MFVEGCFCREISEEGSNHQGRRFAPATQLVARYIASNKTLCDAYFRLPVAAHCQTATISLLAGNIVRCLLMICDFPTLVCRWTVTFTTSIDVTVQQATEYIPVYKLVIDHEGVQSM